MFTGIVEEVGQICSISSDKITINCNKVIQDCNLGDSIAVNGVCLTVSDYSSDSFTADISPETCKITTLSELKKGAEVNLERALTLSTRLGGHLVSGHIDTIGKILKIAKSNNFFEITVQYDETFSKYVVKKGSVAINGISLTVAECGSDFVTIAVIPHTYDMTVLRGLKAGDNVNIEFDILAKYVEKNLLSSNNNNITVGFLAENGFL